MSKINRLMHFYNKNISYQRKNGIWRSRHVAILIACLIMLTPLKVIAAEENLNVNEFPQLQSETAVLMDAETGQILYQKEMNKKMYPASITKIVTGMLALKNAQLTETITMSYDAVFSIDRDSSHIALDVNEQITLEQALYALTIESANDAANGIAELVGGSMEEFVDMMNQTAKDAGAINTNFSNAHGLFDENHYTTSYDMAKITAEAITVPGFTDFFSETYYEIPPTNKQPDTRYIRSNNRLLNGDIPYEGIVMSKTGWTPESQHTLVAVAEQNSTTLIAVVMKSPMADQKWDDIVTLFDYGFTQFYRADFSAAQLTQQLETKEQKKISGLSDFSLLLPEGTSSNDVKAHLDSVADDMGKLPVEVSLCIQTANAKNPEDDLFETTVEVTSLSEKNNPIKDDNSLTGKNDSVPQSSNMRGIVAGIAAVSLILLLFYVLATYRRQQLRRRRKKRHTKTHQRKKIGFTTIAVLIISTYHKKI